MTDNRPAGLGAWLLRLMFLVLVAATPALSQGRDRAPAPQAVEEGTHGTEPSTWLLLATGLGMILLFRCYRQVRQRLRAKPQPMTSGQPRAPAASPSSR